MSAADTPTRFATLKARIEATGHKLMRDVSDRMYILDPSDDERIVATDLDEKTIEREIAYLESRATDTDDDADEPATGKAKVAPKVDVGEAISCIKRVERFVEICAGAVEALDTGNSEQIAFTMNSEIWSDLQDALVALGNQVKDKRGVYHDADAAEGGAT